MTITWAIITFLFGLTFGALATDFVLADYYSAKYWEAREELDEQHNLFHRGGNN